MKGVVNFFVCHRFYLRIEDNLCFPSRISPEDHRARTGSFHSSSRKKQHGEGPTNAGSTFKWQRVYSSLQALPWPPYVTLMATWILIISLASALQRICPYSPVDGLSVLSRTFTIDQASIQTNHQTYMVLIFLLAMTTLVTRVVAVFTTNSSIIGMWSCIQDLPPPRQPCHQRPSSAGALWAQKSGTQEALNYSPLQPPLLDSPLQPPLLDSPLPPPLLDSSLLLGSS